MRLPDEQLLGQRDGECRYGQGADDQGADRTGRQGCRLYGRDSLGPLDAERHAAQAARRLEGQGAGVDLQDRARGRYPPCLQGFPGESDAGRTINRQDLWQPAIATASSWPAASAAASGQPADAAFPSSSSTFWAPERASSAIRSSVLHRSSRRSTSSW